MATFKSSIVRIWGKADSIVGAGFLVDERHIVTCSHVVERALTLGDPGEAGTQANTVSIDFPFLTGASPRVPAHVEDIGRSNVKHWDIGGLVLSGEAPRGASPVRLVTAESMWGHRFRAFGFPPGRDYGEWAVGKIMDAVEGDWLQIDPVDFRGARVREGYSGTPVWDESLEGTAGMVVAADKGDQDRIAYILPASILVEAWSLVLKANSISPCPYRGLSAFTECESQSFFGREAFLATLLEVVKRPTSTILIAPSGSGRPRS
ncbi:MAG: serine protease [Dermatophilaceae bacterium]